MTTATKESRQSRRRKEREKEKAEHAAPQTLSQKQSVLEGLVGVQSLVSGRVLTHAEQDRIENIRGGLAYALGKVVEQAQHMEIDLKIAAIREEIDIYKNGLPNTNQHGEEQKEN